MVGYNETKRMGTFTLAGKPISYHIQRERRKTISIRIPSPELIEVSAPYLVPEFIVARFLEEKRPWIQKKIAQLQEATRSGEQLQYTNGSYLPFFADSYQLRITRTDQAHRTRIYALNHTFQVLVPASYDDDRCQVEVKEAVHGWYLKNTKPVLEQRVAQYAQLMNLSYEKIVVKDVSSQWGSCSSRKTLSFNYRIGLIPVELADYIIVHELSHLVEMNHSARFWKVVASVIPEYKSLRAQLRRRQIMLG